MRYWKKSGYEASIVICFIHSYPTSRERTGDGIGDFLSFDRGTGCEIEKYLLSYRPIALILPSLQMADLPHNVPLIDGSIEQPTKETVKKLSWEWILSHVYQRESHPSNKKTNGGAEILYDQRPCHEPDSNQHFWKNSSELPISLV